MLGDARELTLQVWDHDTISRNDLIGETHLTLPDLASLLRSGSRRSEVPQLELFHPQANHDASKKSLAGPLPSYHPLVTTMPPRRASQA